MAQGFKITFGGEPVVIADRSYALANGKANGFRCPAGRAMGRGAVLLLRSSLNKLGNSGGPFPLKFVTTGDGAETVELPKIYIHSAIRTHGGGKHDDPNAVYLVRLVDSRFFLNNWTDTTNHSFNVRTYAGGDPYKDFLPDTCKAGQRPYTWAEIIETLWAECAMLGSFPGLPDMPKTNGPENVRLIGSAWHAVNDLVEKLGFYITYDPRNDFFQIVKAKTLGTFPTKGSILYNSGAFSPDCCLVPEKIRVYFSKQFQDYGTERDVETTGNWSTTDAIYWFDVNTNASGAVGGTTKAIWVETPAVKQAGTNQILNEAQLKTMAQERAQAWVNINQADKLSRLDFIEQGLLNVVPNEELKVVWWRAFAGEGLVTEVITHPGMPTDGEGPSQAMQSVAGTNDGSGGGGGSIGGQIDVLKESNSAPDLARATYPNYPRLPNIVKITLGTVTTPAVPGFIKAYERNYIFGGNLLRYNPVMGELEDLQSCWIYLTGQNKNAPGAKQKLPGPMSELNQVYYARLSGTYKAQTGQFRGRTLPLYVACADDATSVSAACACASNGAAMEVENVERANRITFDKGVGFKIYRDFAENGNACVSLYGCLPNSILNQQQPFPQRPVWTQSPRLGGNLTIGGALKFGGDQGGSVMGSGSHIRLPGYSDGCGYPVEVVGTKGNCIQLGYGIKGYTGLFYAYDCYGFCQTFVVVNGRIGWTNAPFMAPHQCKGSAPCPPNDTKPCLPCSTQNQRGTPDYYKNNTAATAASDAAAAASAASTDSLSSIGFDGITNDVWQQGQPAMAGFGLGSDGNLAILANPSTPSSSGTTASSNTSATPAGTSNTVARIAAGSVLPLVNGKYQVCSSYDQFGKTVLLRDGSPLLGWRKAAELVAADFKDYRPLTAEKAAELLGMFSHNSNPDMVLSATCFDNFKNFVFRCNATDLGQSTPTTASTSRPPYSVECNCSGFLFYPSDGKPSGNFNYAAAILKNSFKQWRPFDNWQGVNGRLADFDPNNTSETNPPTHKLTDDEFTIFRLECYCFAKKQFDADFQKIWY